MTIRFHCDDCGEHYRTVDEAGKCEQRHVIIAAQAAEARKKNEQAQQLFLTLPEDHPLKIQ